MIVMLDGGDDEPVDEEEVEEEAVDEAFLVPVEAVPSLAVEPEVTGLTFFEKGRLV